jgi:meso-butanediol dehydrogenase/(S,S)-butanediol dehydrogenase/diacetyl reductase
MSGPTTFEGLRAVVTGAAGVLGACVVDELCMAGASVVAIDRDAAALERLVGQTADGGGELVTRVVDVSSSSEVLQVAVDAAGSSGIDLLFNNAGIEGATASVADLSEDDFDEVWRVNVRGMFLVSKHFGSRMNRGGAIVNTASVAALKGYAERSAYVTSKHAVLGLTRCLALELAERQIRVNAVCPGPIDSPMMERIEADSGDPTSARKKGIAAVPLKRYGSATEIASFVLFLLSDGARFATGTAFTVDGGLTTGA